MRRARQSWPTTRTSIPQSFARSHAVRKLYAGPCSAAHRTPLASRPTPAGVPRPSAAECSGAPLRGPGASFPWRPARSGGPPAPSRPRHSGPAGVCPWLPLPPSACPGVSRASLAAPSLCPAALRGRHTAPSSPSSSLRSAARSGEGLQEHTASGAEDHRTLPPSSAARASVPPPAASSCSGAPARGPRAASPSHLARGGGPGARARPQRACPPASAPWQPQRLSACPASPASPPLRRAATHPAPCA
mmetsp:Transcript_114325/g.318250  ORF Transcript_114325/g.318250 Transcript_114325/m.318250 type:complete len:247 (-) Transcript_114325:957-1697(-)